MRYRATLAYDGTAYAGFQRQAAGIVTIQGTVEAAIGAVSGQTVTVTGAGRTDSGVHAVGQVIAFDLDWPHAAETLLGAINANLPEDIALQDLMPAPPGFHPRFDAWSRVYRYEVIQSTQRQPLLRDRTWRVWCPLAGGVMQQAADLLIGEHDFGAFGQPPQGDSTIRQIFRSEWVQQPTPYGIQWTYFIEANAFLKHMVRRVTALLVAVGQSRLRLDEFEIIFRRADLAAVKLMAPPQGLTLEAVRYLSDGN
jgi:tRNA pseudouridine38-40 synthase